MGQGEAQDRASPAHLRAAPWCLQPSSSALTAFAAATRFWSEAMASGHPRVLSPQFGLLRSAARSTTARRLNLGAFRPCGNDSRMSP
jgi:hypothetical protein